MLAPYPKELCDAAVDYWGRLGFDIVALSRVGIGRDTRAIYELTDTHVSQALERFADDGADLILLSGTGMPTVRVHQQSTVPMLSSNFRFATEVLRRIQL